MQQKNEMMPFTATGMDVEIVTQSESNQKETDKLRMISLTCEI